MKKTLKDLIIIKKALSEASNLTNDDAKAKQRLEFVVFCVKNCQAIDKATKEAQDLITDTLKAMQADSDYDKYNKSIRQLQAKFEGLELEKQAILLEEQHPKALELLTEFGKFEEKETSKEFELELLTISHDKLPSDIKGRQLNPIYDLIQF